MIVSCNKEDAHLRVAVRRLFPSVFSGRGSCWISRGYLCTSVIEVGGPSGMASAASPAPPLPCTRWYVQVCQGGKEKGSSTFHALYFT